MAEGKEAQISRKGPTLCVMWANRAHLFMMGWLAAKSASADSRFQHGSTEATWQTDPADLRASYTLSLSVQ